ncbi:MAG: SCP2 sterol-binding domain-containing protein [Halothiobacillaceae bacterium]|nr:SCP2 sterol-binding domain-containing protein [Halothiobacillaceae bacterium]
MHLPILLTAALESGLNRLIALDEDAAQRLAEFSGRVIGVRFDGPMPVNIFLLPGNDGLYLMGRHEGLSDATLVISPFGLLRLPLRAHPADGAFTQDLRFEGDAALGARFARTLAELDPDWEEALSRHLGDALAHSLGSRLRALNSWAARTLDHRALDGGEYLREETRLSPGREETDGFLDGVDRLREDVERLDERIARLDRTLAERD